jgi:hypothetical protein
VNYKSVWVLYILHMHFYAGVFLQYSIHVTYRCSVSENFLKILHCNILPILLQ